jgi:hypothetical protein
VLQKSGWQAMLSASPRVFAASVPLIRECTDRARLKRRFKDE